MQITDLRLAMDEAHAAIIAHKKESEAKLNDLTGKYERAAREYALATDSLLDIEKIRNAESIIAIRGRMGERKNYEGKLIGMGIGDDLAAVEQAIKWMACSYQPTSYTDLNSVYFGCKDYDRWTHQREDCQYGYGPRHGSIVFAIELRSEHRNKRLTKQQRSDCIYYLEALKAGKLRTNATKLAP